MLTATLTAKLSFWQCVPHLWCGLANRDITLARAAAQTALQQTAQLTAEGKPLHPLTAKFCALQSDLADLIQGKPMSQKLALEAARLKLLPTSERAAEAPHSQLHRAISQTPHYSAALLSMQLRGGEVLELMRQPAAFRQFAQFCQENRQPHQLVSTLGFGAHPAVVATATGPHDKLRQSLAAAVYRLDLATQYADRRGQQRELLRKKRALRTRSSTAPGPGIW